MPSLKINVPRPSDMKENKAKLGEKKLLKRL